MHSIKESRATLISLQMAQGKGGLGKIGLYWGVTHFHAKWDKNKKKIGKGAVVCKHSSRITQSVSPVPFHVNTDSHKYRLFYT